MLKGFIFRYWILLAIFILALFLRVYNLSNFPVGLHGDEASIGYNAYSLLQTGKDQNNNVFPLAIDQFGDFRPAGYHYLDIPFVAIFGLNEFAVRLPAALFASLSVFAIFLLVRELLDNKKVAMGSALLLAILPWDINISRASSESVIATFFVLVGLYFLVRFIKNKKNSLFLLAASLLPLWTSFFFYHAHRFFVPVFLLFAIPILLIAFKQTKKKLILSGIFYLFIIGGLVFFLLAGKGTGRASSVSIFNIPGGTTQLKQAMDEEGTLNPLINRFYNNKLFFYGRLFGTFYSQHLSGDFLFVNNGYPVRYRLPHTGNLYPVMLPFLIFGFVVLLSEGARQKKVLYLIPVAWLFIAPIPAGLTWEDLPNVIRSSLMIPVLVIIVSFGFFEALTFFKKKQIRNSVLAICLILLTQSFLNFTHNYYWRLKVHEPWYRSSAEKELLFQVSQLEKANKKIVMTTERNNNLIFYLFYNKFDPATFQKMGSPKEKDGLIFQNIMYVNDSCPLRGEAEEIVKYDSAIFIGKEDCPLPKNSEILQLVRFPDGIPAFKIARILPTQ